MKMKMKAFERKRGSLNFPLGWEHPIHSAVVLLLAGAGSCRFGEMRCCLVVISLMYLSR